jgi:cytochrome b
MNTEISKKYKIKIWPKSIRIFHWLLVTLIASIFITAEKDQWLNYHIYLGYITLGLISWRIIQGFYGSFYLRFKNFVVSQKEQVDYLQDLSKLKPPSHIGHPPPAGWMIVGFLVMIIVIGLSGIMTYAGEERHIFWGFQVSNNLGKVFKVIHEGSSTILGGMIFLHVCGVLVDSVLHRKNLTKSMITGQKQVSESQFKEYQKNYKPSSWPIWTFFLLGCIVGVILLVANQQTNQISLKKQSPIKISKAEKLWKDECGSCHQTYHPSLLPVRSWKKVMKQLDSHFGDDASLEEKDTQIITSFLIKHSAEFSTMEAAYKINRSIPKNVTPIAITTTAYWVKKHDEIERETYKRSSIKSKANCLACHSDAISGEYEDDLISTPK